MNENSVLKSKKEVAKALEKCFLGFRYRDVVRTAEAKTDKKLFCRDRTNYYIKCLFNEAKAEIRRQYGTLVDVTYSINGGLSGIKVENPLLDQLYEMMETAEIKEANRTAEYSDAIRIALFTSGLTDVTEQLQYIFVREAAI